MRYRPNKEHLPTYSHFIIQGYLDSAETPSSANRCSFP